MKKGFLFFTIVLLGLLSTSCVSTVPVAQPYYYGYGHPQVIVQQPPVVSRPVPPVIIHGRPAYRPPYRHYQPYPPRR